MGIVSKDSSGSMAAKQHKLGNWAREQRFIATIQYETLHKALTQRVDVKANAACEWSIINWPFVGREVGEEKANRQLQQCTVPSVRLGATFLRCLFVYLLYPPMRIDFSVL